MSAATIPQEAGIDDRAVSFTKGCYIGQETVARLHYKGKPNRHLRGLRLDGPVADGDRDQRSRTASWGEIGTAVISPALGPIALAVIRREAEPGARVTVGEAGVGAEVVALPVLTDRRRGRAGGSARFAAMGDGCLERLGGADAGRCRGRSGS